MYIYIIITLTRHCSTNFNQDRYFYLLLHIFKTRTKVVHKSVSLQVYNDIRAFFVKTIKQPIHNIKKPFCVFKELSSFLEEQIIIIEFLIKIG